MMNWRRNIAALVVKMCFFLEPCFDVIPNFNSWTSDVSVSFFVEIISNPWESIVRFFPGLVLPFFNILRLLVDLVWLVVVYKFVLKYLLEYMLNLDQGHVLGLRISIFLYYCLWSISFQIFWFFPFFCIHFTYGWKKIFIAKLFLLPSCLNIRLVSKYISDLIFRCVFVQFTFP